MARIQHITFACDDPDALATFWEAALEAERRELPVETEMVLLERPDGGPELLFREAPRGTDRDLPIHLDLGADDRLETVERLEELGARVRETKTLETDEYEHIWTVMEDPEGNGFCVTEYH